MEQAIGGGRMTKKEADEKAKMIFEDLNKKCEEIIKQAKKDGVWKSGLDSNKELFFEVENEAKEKLRKLSLQINEVDQNNNDV